MDERDYKNYRSRGGSFEDDDRYYRQRKRSNYEDDYELNRMKNKEYDYGPRDLKTSRDYKDNTSNYDSHSERIRDLKEEPSNCLRVRGLWYGVTESMISTLLAAFKPMYISITDKTSIVNCFVEFSTVEIAKEVLDSYPGSYNGVGKSLELDGKCLYLSFARPLSRRQKEFSNADIKTNNPYKEKVLEWLCNCGVLNYHGRNSCRKCFTEKKDKTITVLTSDNLTFYISPIPTTLLIVQGLPISVNETFVNEYFRKFAPVKDVFQFKDPSTLIYLPTFIIEFNEVSSAIHVKNQSSVIRQEFLEFWTDFAEESFCRKLIVQQKNIGMLQPAGYATINNWLATNVNKTSHISSDVHLSSVASISGPSRPANQNIPPSFELFGASYLFQPKSGMFHEPVSNFYYIPKLKLYYNGKNGQYLIQSCVEETGEIVLKNFFPPLPLEAEEEINDDAKIDDNTEKLIEPIKPLSISLNKSKLKKKIINFEQNPNQANISKWGQIQKEEREREKIETSNIESDAFSKNVIKNSSETKESSLSSTSIPSSSPSIQVNKSPQIVCLICRRQFTSQELLQRHERESKLHAENVKKMEENSSNKLNNQTISNSNNSISKLPNSNPPITTKYRDRAEERREKYGLLSDISKPSPSYSSSTFAPSYSSSIYVPSNSYSSSSSFPSDLTKDENNMGHQLLKKMGWNEENNKEALGVTLSKSGASNYSNAGLGHDSRQFKNDSNQTMYYNKSGQEYRDVLNMATRNRYEMLFKNDQNKK